MQAHIKQAIESLKGHSLTKTTRNELVQFFHFGKTHYTTSQGLVLDVGALVLSVDCPWVLEQAGGDPIKHSEVFIRKREAGLPSSKFDWKIPGANLRDQRLQEWITSSLPNTVKDLIVEENKSLTIYFASDAQLSVTPELMKEQETYWQLFSNTGDNFSMTAGSAGII